MADLRFSNQGPIVLGLGGTYPSYASIPNVFGGPTQGILISVYNRGGSYVPDTTLNQTIPTTINTGNPVDWSDYYTTSNYVPGPGPNPLNPGTTFVQPTTPYQVYIGETYNFGKLVTKGVFTNALCTSVLISGVTAINTAGVQENISFVVQAGMNYDITTPADVVVNTSISTVKPTVSNYFTRYPIDSSLVSLPNVISATTDAAVTVDNLRSLQVDPLPTVTIGGVVQTVTVAQITSSPNALLVFTVSADTPLTESDIVITNAAGDSTTLTSKFKRSEVPMPAYPPIDRGPPPNIDWQAHDPIPETLSITVSSNFVAKPAGDYTPESVTSYPPSTQDNYLTDTSGTIVITSALINGTTTGGNVNSYLALGSTSTQFGAWSPAYALAYPYPDYPNILPVSYPSVSATLPAVGWDSFSNDFAYWFPGGAFIYDNYSSFVLYPTYYTAPYRRGTGTLTFSANSSQYAAWRIIGTIAPQGTNYIQLTGSVNRNASLIEFANNGNGAFSSSGGDRGSVSSIDTTPVSGTTNVYAFSGPNIGPPGTTVYCRDSWITAISASTAGGGASLTFSYNGTLYALANGLSSLSSGSPPTVTQLSSGANTSYLFSAQAQRLPTGIYFGGYIIGSGGTITVTNFVYGGSSISGNWVTGNIQCFANSSSANVCLMLVQGNNYYQPICLAAIFDYSTVSGRPGTNYYYNVARLDNTSLALLAVDSAFYSLQYVSGNAWYLYYRRYGGAPLQRVLIYYDPNSLTASPPPATQYSISRPANADYGWSALNLTYNPASTDTPQQVANAINTLLLNNWGGTVLPTSTVTSDMNGNWTINFNTNVPAMSNTQIMAINSPQTGTITSVSSGGTLGDNLSRLSIMNAQNQVFIDVGYGYVSNGTSFLTFTHDADSFNGSSKVIQNNYTPTSIRDIITII
jgi:hypothetical protein